jgi:hypothetical protein
MAETTKKRDDDEAHANDTITAYNRMLVGDPPPDDNYTTKLEDARRSEASDRAFREGYPRQRAARLRQFGIKE